MKNPKAKMWLGLGLFAIFIGLALLIAAGTVNYWQAWVYLGVVFVTSIPLTLYTTSNAKLLENRTKNGLGAEKRTIQKIIVLYLGFASIATFIIPALDYRFGWSNLPSWLPFFGELLILISMWLVYKVFKENAFGSTTVEITKNQKAISTGPYAIVRNPMYSCAVLFYIGTTLSLGSYWGFIPAILTIIGFAWRLLDEEKFLSENLSGYIEYQKKVKYHLIPYIW